MKTECSSINDSTFVLSGHPTTWIYRRSYTENWLTFEHLKLCCDDPSIVALADDDNHVYSDVFSLLL